MQECYRVTKMNINDLENYLFPTEIAQRVKILNRNPAILLLTEKHPKIL